MAISVPQAELVDSPVGAEPAADPGEGAFEALFEIGCQLQARQIHLEHVLDLIVRKAAALLGTDISWVALHDEEANCVRTVVTHGARWPAFGSLEVEIGEGLGGVALRRSRTLVVTDYRSYQHTTPTWVRETMCNEGIVSVICAPMLCDNTMVGALYVANRHKTAFGSSQTTLLSTFAAQASVAIQNGSLYRELESRNRLLEQSFAIHRELNAAELREVGLGGVALTLARLLDRSITVSQEVLQPFVSRYAPTTELAQDESDDRRMDEATAVATTVPIVAGDEELGQIVVAGGSLSELQERALEHGATVMALELLKQRAARDVEWRLQGELLEELIEADDPLPETLVLRAQRMHIDPGRPRQLFAIEADDERVGYGRLVALVRRAAASALGAAGEPALAVKRGARVILALPELTSALEADLIRTIESSVQEAGSTVSMGISRAMVEVGPAYREAIACLMLARRGRKRQVVVRASNLGPVRFLLDAPNLEHASAMVRERLGPLVEVDRNGRTPLMETLRAYLEADGHQQTVAAKCFIHVSTLKYRLSRIQQALDAPLSDADLRFELRLAYHVLDLLEALGVDPLEAPSSTAGPAKRVSVRSQTS